MKNNSFSKLIKMFKFYFYGSYFASHINVIYSILNNKKNGFECTTPGSTIYTLSSLILSPVMLPVNLSYQIYLRV